MSRPSTTAWNSIEFIQSVKENDRRASKRVLKSALFYFGMLQVFFLFLYLLYRFEEGPTGVKKGYVRVNKRGESFSLSSSHSHANKELAVMEARYYLIDLTVANMQMASSSYSGVKATFCPLDWHLQKDKPSSVPMFRDLVKRSSRCDDAHKVTFELSNIVDKIRKHDNSNHAAPVKQLELSGAVFHETRCGSTLVSNLLSAQDPVTNRVYSENSVILQALTVCDQLQQRGLECDEAMADQMLQDVMYILNRSSDKREVRVFYKLQSVGTYQIDRFTRNFPSCPFIFVFRDGVEIMGSHFPNKDIGTKKAVCLRSRNHPPQIVKELVEAAGRDISDLSNAEYCAVHLASLCEAALREQAVSNKGRFVNYNTLPEAVWDWILPEHFGVPVHEHQVHHMKQVAQQYSKERSSNVVWEGDSEHKQETSSEEVQQAVKLFLTRPFERMQSLSSAYGAAS